jgi:hypothetical protein
MKAPRTEPPGARRFEDLAAALVRIETRQAACEEVIHRILDVLEVHNKKLDVILEAATREPGPSPVAETLTAILLSLREQENLLLDLPQALAEAMHDERRRGAADEDDMDDPDLEDDPDGEPPGSWRFVDRAGAGS